MERAWSESLNVIRFIYFFVSPLVVFLRDPMFRPNTNLHIWGCLGVPTRDGQLDISTRNIVSPLTKASLVPLINTPLMSFLL